MDEVHTVSLAGGEREITVVPHGRTTRRPSTVTTAIMHCILNYGDFYFLQGCVIIFSFVEKLCLDEGGQGPADCAVLVY